MYSSIKRGLIIIVLLSVFACSGKKAVGPKTFYNFDSLVNNQVRILKSSRLELNKSVEIDGKQEQTQFVPDSIQWSNELEIFRQLDEVNKASFRDIYTVNDIRDTNSNLMVREFKAQGQAPVSLLRIYYLRDPSDVRKIEATWFEENTLYVNTRHMTMELESGVLNNYRVEGSQKMVMSDSVRFMIAGQLAGELVK